MLRIVLLLRLFAGFVAGDDVVDEVAALPDDIKRIIQADALHLYKYAESPIAPILNLTQTTDYFPILRDLAQAVDLQILTWVRPPPSYPSRLYDATEPILDSLGDSGTHIRGIRGFDLQHGKSELSRRWYLLP